jgi:DNA-binding SARP family transcriptional activator
VGDVEVEVAVLGPVDVRGAAHAFCRAAARELVVYLAFHRRGAVNGEWADALWPTRSISPSTLHSTSSDARRALGRAADGSEHLPRNGRLLRLRTTVGTDVERFAALASDGDPVRQKEALGLIRGPLFGGSTHADWAVFDGTQARVESMVADTALEAAERCMARRCGHDAESMVRQALRVCPFDERLYRALLRAAAAQGNRLGLRTTMHQLLALASDGGDPIVPSTPLGAGIRDHSAIHPETVALYRELAGGGAPAVGGHLARL